MRLIHLPVALATALIAGIVPAAAAAAAPAAVPGHRGISAAPGTELWEADYDVDTPGFDFGHAVAASPSGSTVFVTGQSEDSVGESNAGTVAYAAATGTQLWSALYPGRGVGNATADAIAVSPDGSTVYITGSSDQNSGAPEATTVAYAAATGTQLWVASYRGAGLASASAIAVSPDGTKLFVSGTTDNGKLHAVRHFLTLAYDTASGTLLWHRRQWWPVNKDSIAQALAVSPDGSTVFVTGFRYGADGDQQFATLAYNTATGARRWVRTAGFTAANGTASSAVVSPDGSAVFISGQAGGDVVTEAYAAATGAPLWTARFAVGSFAGPAAVSPDGSALYVAGRGTAGGFKTVAYDAATGTRHWTASYSSPGTGISTFATALALSHQGSTVYVTGGTIGPSGPQGYLTAAFDAATGTRLWVTASDQHTEDPAAIAAGANGLVFVTGEGFVSDVGVYATVALQG